MAEPSVPFPLFPPLALLKEHAHAELPINREVRQRLEAFPEHLAAVKAWRTGILFLLEYSGRPEINDEHYKLLCPIIESMMHWSWSIRRKALHDWDSLDARAFIDFIMHPPITWVTTPGCVRYSRKARLNFADKPLDAKWRPIMRKKISANDPGLSTKHHRDRFLVRGREYFAFTASLGSQGDEGISIALAGSNAQQENPFQNVSRQEFEVHAGASQGVFTSGQLSDFLEIAESLTDDNKKWEACLFIFAVTVYSDIPIRALWATQNTKPLFSYFKARNPDAAYSSLTQHAIDFANVYPSLFKGPEKFESPLYPSLQCTLAPEFQRYFLRYAQYRHFLDQSLSKNSFLLLQENGMDAYAYEGFVRVFREFTVEIIHALRLKSASVKRRRKGSNNLEPKATLSFVELRASAKRAGWIPKPARGSASGEIIWPDIGIRKNMSASQWFQSHWWMQDIFLRGIWSRIM